MPVSVLLSSNSHRCLAAQAQSYTNYFADALSAEAAKDNLIVGIHAAMGGGTGMNRMEMRFADRVFDTGEGLCAAG